MMEKLQFLTALMVATLLVACASTGSGRGRVVGNVLTHDELVATNEPNLYMAIQSLRPRWLQPRGQTSLAVVTVVTVFLDGSPRGHTSELISMRLANIITVTYLSPSEAAFRFGTIAGSGGSIEIDTRHQDWATSEADVRLSLQHDAWAPLRALRRHALPELSICSQ